MTELHTLTNATDDDVLKLAAAIRARRGDEAVARSKTIQQRIENGDIFTDDELIYAAAARCRCGAGLAYPEGIGMGGAWYCADVITARVTTGDGAWDSILAKAHDCKPFLSWEIKSERQPSANGATTRRKDSP
jgi:hypothetical protein